MLNHLANSKRALAVFGAGVVVAATIGLAPNAHAASAAHVEHLIHCGNVPKDPNCAAVEANASEKAQAATYAHDLDAYERGTGKSIPAGQAQVDALPTAEKWVAQQAALAAQKAAAAKAAAAKRASSSSSASSSSTSSSSSSKPSAAQIAALKSRAASLANAVSRDQSEVAAYQASYNKYEAQLNNLRSQLADVQSVSAAQNAALQAANTNAGEAYSALLQWRNQLNNDEVAYNNAVAAYTQAAGIYGA